MTDNKKTVVTTEHKIGKVTYIICASSSQRATDTLDKKIKELIKREVEENAENNK